MTEEPKFYRTTDQGVATFVWFVTAGEDTFDHVDIEGNHPVLVFRDDMKATPCAELAQLYHNGAMVRDAKELCNCYRAVVTEIRLAYRTQAKKAKT